MIQISSREHKNTHDLFFWKFLLQADKLLVDEFEELHDLLLLVLSRFEYGSIYLNIEVHLNLISDMLLIIAVFQIIFHLYSPSEPHISVFDSHIFIHITTMDFGYCNVIVSDVVRRAILALRILILSTLGHLPSYIV